MAVFCIITKLTNKKYKNSKFKKVYIFCQNLIYGGCKYLYLSVNCKAKSSNTLLSWDCKSLSILAASSSNFSPPIASNSFSNWTLSCWMLFIRMHAYKNTELSKIGFLLLRGNYACRVVNWPRVAYHSFILRMLRELLFNNVCIGEQNFYNGFCKSFHITLPNVRIRTLELWHDVKTLGELLNF